MRVTRQLAQLAPSHRLASAGTHEFFDTSLHSLATIKLSNTPYARKHFSTLPATACAPPLRFSCDPPFQREALPTITDRQVGRSTRISGKSG